MQVHKMLQDKKGMQTANVCVKTKATKFTDTSTKTSHYQYFVIFNTDILTFESLFVKYKNINTFSILIFKDSTVRQTYMKSLAARQI